MLNPLKTWLLSNNLVLIIISVYFLISVIKLSHPGVNNDQFMFVNAASFNPDNMFNWKSFHGFPIMVFPYIGALKSYIYMPIFYLFGVSIWTIRIPQLLITATSIFILYKTLLLSFNKNVALLTILFLSLDPSLIAHSRIDTGPIVLEFLLKILAVYFLFKYLTTKKIIYFLIVYPVLALGLFNKINYFWFLNAFLVSFILIYGKTFYNNLKSIGKSFPFFLIFIPYFLLIHFFQKLSREVSLSYKNFSNEVSPFNLYSNLPIFYKNLSELISGDQLYQMIYGQNPTNFGIYIALTFFAVTITGCSLIIIKRKLINKNFLSSFYFFLTMFILTSLEIILTKRATSSWHTLAVYPFFTILFSLSCWQIYQTLKSKIQKNIFKLMLLAIIIYLLIVNSIYIINYSKPTKLVAYSSSIYELVDFAKDRQEHIICLDVDICNQLLTLTQQSTKYKEPFSFLDEPTYQTSFDQLKNNFNQPNKFLYIDHDSKNSHFPKFQQAFLNFISLNKVNIYKVKEVRDGADITFTIYRLANQALD